MSGIITISVNHQPSGGREYVAEIVGVDPKYGLARAFLNVYGRDWSSSRKTGTTRYRLTPGKVYEVRPSWKDRYYVRCTEEGYERITRDEAQQYADTCATT